jgi:hypothetical protein
MRKTPPWYYLLPRATRPSTLKGCVGTLQDGYVRASPELTAPKAGIPLPGYSRLPAWIPTLPR